MIQEEKAMRQFIIENYHGDIIHSFDDGEKAIEWCQDQSYSHQIKNEAIGYFYQSLYEHGSVMIGSLSIVDKKFTKNAG